MKQTILFLIALSFLSSYNSQKHSVKNDCKGAIIDEKIEALSEYNKRFYDENFTGIVTKTFKESKKLEWKLNYKDGKITKYESFYENGDPKILEPVKCNSIHGNLIYYIDNAKKRYELEYKLGKKDGGGKSYFENGQVQKEVHYKNDQKDGNQYMFDEKGDTISIEIFKSGILIK